MGLKRWNQKRAGKSTPEKRPGVTVNRRDLVAIPIPDANLLWRDLHVRDVRRVDGRQRTGNIRIDLVVEGVTRGRPWTCGLEFDYANEESFYCRPLRLSEDGPAGRMPVPDEAGQVRIAFLPPMSGLAATETRLDQYYQAEQTGWVLYLEGSTDLSILVAFARRLGHDRALRALERPFVRYAGNQARAVQSHFHGLREALPRLRGAALFDRLEPAPPDMAPIECLTWRRREIESYVCTRVTLEACAAAAAPDAGPGPLFSAAEADRRLRAMRECIAEIESALKTLGRGSPWDADLKASDEFLDRLFQSYFDRLGLPNLMAKKNYHELVDHVPDNDIDPEIREKLDAIAGVAEQAKPAGEDG